MKIKPLIVAIATMFAVSSYANNGNGNVPLNGQPFKQLEGQIVELKTFVVDELNRIDNRLVELEEEISRVETDSIARDEATVEFVELLVERMEIVEFRLDEVDVRLDEAFFNIDTVSQQVSRLDSRLDSDVESLNAKMIYRDTQLLRQLESAMERQYNVLESNFSYLLGLIDNGIADRYNLERQVTSLYNTMQSTGETLRDVAETTIRLQRVLGSQCPGDTKVTDIFENGTVWCSSGEVEYKTLRSYAVESRECVTDILIGCANYDYWQTISVYCPAGYEVLSYSLNGTYTRAATQYYLYSGGRKSGVFWRSTRYDSSIDGDILTDSATKTYMTMTCKRDDRVQGRALQQYNESSYTIHWPDGTTTFLSQFSTNTNN